LWQGVEAGERGCQFGAPAPVFGDPDEQFALEVGESSGAASLRNATKNSPPHGQPTVN
jgi:hypothetical protein